VRQDVEGLQRHRPLDGRDRGGNEEDDRDADGSAGDEQGRLRSAFAQELERENEVERHRQSDG
jgi:hypothetical protein